LSKYCSRRCYKIAAKIREKVRVNSRCEICDKLLTPGHTRCFAHHFHISGQAHPWWKGGKTINSSGYMKIRIKGKYILEHRFIWEQHYGKLPDGFVVHHINGIKDDNRIENLIALPYKKHHSHLVKQDLAKMIICCPHCGEKFPYLAEKVVNNA